MKRILYNIKVSLLALVLAGTMSCQNYLNLTDPESLSDGNFPTNIDHIGLIVNSVYGVQHHWYFLGNYWAGYVMYCLDHTIDMQWHNDQEWINISAGEVKAGNVKVTDPWTGLSLGVYYANSALEKISLYRQNAQPAEAEALDNYEGECLFFRAFYWWHMLSLYAEPDMDGVGIPIIKAHHADRPSQGDVVGREGFPGKSVLLHRRYRQCEEISGRLYHEQREVSGVVRELPDDVQRL